MLIAHVSFTVVLCGGGVGGPLFNFLDWTNTSHLKTTKEEGNALVKDLHLAWVTTHRNGSPVCKYNVLNNNYFCAKGIDA